MKIFSSRFHKMIINMRKVFHFLLNMTGKEQIVMLCPLFKLSSPDLIASEVSKSINIERVSRMNSPAPLSKKVIFWTFTFSLTHLPRHLHYFFRILLELSELSLICRMPIECYVSYVRLAIAANLVIGSRLPIYQLKVCVRF